MGLASRFGIAQLSVIFTILLKIMDFQHFSGPPRPVPAGLVLRIAFGGVGNVIGWGVFGFGMIFFLAMGLDTNLFTFYHFLGDLEKVPGRVIRCEDTHVEINERTIVKWKYTFEYQGQPYIGNSYAPEQEVPEGTPVTVEFAPGSPEYSRIEGLSEAIGSWWLTLLLLLFPGFGLALLGYNWVQVPKNLWLLRHGILAQGFYKDKQPTNVTVNDRREYKLRFVFKDGAGAQHSAFAKSHTLTELTDEPSKPLLYDPNQPDRAVLLAALPGQPNLGDDGHWQSSGGFLWLLAPLLAILINGLILLYRLT
jgi:hypothetical protein